MAGIGKTRAVIPGRVHRSTIASIDLRSGYSWDLAGLRSEESEGIMKNCPRTRASGFQGGGHSTLLTMAEAGPALIVDEER